jgi:hypothetical protein
LNDEGGRRTSGRKIGILLVPAAAAIAIGLVAMRLHFQPPTVPAYTLATPAPDAVLERGASFELVLKPESPVDGAIGARAFLVRGQEARAWEPPQAVGLDGSVRIAGPVETLFAGVPPGDWEVAVAVGRPETLPTLPREVALACRTAPASNGRRLAWRLVTQTVRLRN